MLNSTRFVTVHANVWRRYRPDRHILACNRNSHQQAHSRYSRPPTITDEGLIIHEADPTTSGDGLGLVWGSVLWPSGVSLAKYLTWKGPGFVQSKRILELGCGTGVVGLTLAARLEAQQVTLTDSESSLWPILRNSIESNNIPEEKVRIHGLDWRDPSTFLMASSSDFEFDLVVAADVLYSGMDKLFARALAAHLPSVEEAAVLTEAIIACPFRNDSPLLGFFDTSTRLGLEFDRLENDHGQAVGAFSGTSLGEAFEGSQFVPLRTTEILHQVSTQPTFSPLNVKRIQTFRVRRARGTASEAGSIRRVSRI